MCCISSKRCRRRPRGRRPPPRPLRDVPELRVGARIRRRLEAAGEAEPTRTRAVHDGRARENPSRALALGRAGRSHLQRRDRRGRAPRSRKRAGVDQRRRSAGRRRIPLGRAGRDRRSGSRGRAPVVLPISLPPGSSCPLWGCGGGRTGGFHCRFRVQGSGEHALRRGTLPPPKHGLVGVGCGRSTARPHRDNLAHGK